MREATSPQRVRHCREEAVRGGLSGPACAICRKENRKSPLGPDRVRLWPASAKGVRQLTCLARRLVYRAMASKSRSLCQTGTRFSMAIAAMRQSVEERIV